MIYLAVILMTLIGASGAFFFKRSAVKANGIFSLVWIPSFYLGGFLYGLSALFDVILLRYVDYTILYPMTAITYIWSLIISKIFLGEKITKNKIVGVALICLGVVLLNAS